MNIHDHASRTLLVENSIDLLSNLRDRTGFTAALAVLTKDEQRGLVLASLPGLSDHGYLPRVGFRFHLHATAPGKALLASLPPSKQSRIIRNLDLQRFTDNTFATEKTLRAHLRECGKRQFVFDKGEYVHGVNCVAGCIKPAGQPWAAVWITSLMVDLPDAALPKFGQEIICTVGQMELRLRSVIESQSLKHEYNMERARAFIDEHFHNEDAVRRYHETIGMSDSWFRHLFREKYGVAPQSYRLKLLHERARRLLTNTNLSIKEIAFQLGYDSQNYFSRAFKNKDGVSPARFREIGRSSQSS